LKSKIINISQESMPKELDVEEKNSSAETSVREGYIQTKLGWIPVDWGIVRLNETGKIITGSTPKTAEIENYNGDYLFVSPADIDSRKYINETIKTLSHIGFSKGRKVKKDSILFVCIGSTIGKLAIAGKELITNQQINSIIPSENFDSDFLYYQLSRNSKRIKLMAGEQAVPLINKTDFSKVKIVAPPLPEQRNIAEILSTWDKAIALQEQLIAEKQALKKGLMQELLTGKKRFPGFTEEWEEVKLEDVCDVKGKYGIGAAAVEFSNELPRYLRITDIDDEGDYSPEKEVSVSDKSSNEYVLEEGDIVFARTGNTTGKTYLYQEKDGVLVYAGFLIKFRPNQEYLSPEFLKFYTQTAHYWYWVQTMSVRSGQPGINSKEYGKLKLLIPKIDEQEKIAALLSEFDIEIKKLSKYKNVLIQQKQGLMQQLLTGEKRIKI